MANASWLITRITQRSSWTEASGRLRPAFHFQLPLPRTDVETEALTGSTAKAAEFVTGGAGTNAQASGLHARRLPSFSCCHGHVPS